MANQLSKTGISDSQTLYAAHVTQSIDALTGVEAYDLVISGSLKATGSISISGPTYVSPSPPYDAFQMQLNAITTDNFGNPYMTMKLDSSFVTYLNFPDDVTAAFHNIPVGGLYHDNGTLRIRIV